MNVLIVGAGKTGAFLAEKLRGKHAITIVEARTDRAQYIRLRMPDVRVVRGDGCEPSVLDKAGVGTCDIVAALTGDDEDNLVVSFLAKTTHRVPLVFARVNHPANEWMFTKTWGVDFAVSTSSMIYAMVEKELGVGTLVTLMGIHSKDTVIDEITLTTGMRAVGKAISDLALPKRTSVMAVVSGGGLVAPKGDTVLSAGDDVLILSHTSEEAEVRRAFGVED